MNVFSKPLKHEEEILTYIEFFKNEIDISKLKLTDLKNIARKNKFRISGSKEILKERVYTFFLESNACSIIQKYFRGHLVRYSFKLRGPAYKRREKCVNDTDFVSLDPLKEIEFHDFYSYQDSKGFIYGFSISSLISSWKRNRTLTNPYNRELFDSNMVSNIHTLHRMKDTIFYFYKPQVKQPENVSAPPITTNSYRLSSHGSIRVHPSGQSNMMSFPNSNNRELIQRMEEIQQKPLNLRIQELFMEIDNLGNYTQAAWFDNLSTSDCIRYLRYLGDIWNYRGQLSDEIKRNICSILDPFAQRFFYPDARDPHENIRQVCVFVLEHMIYTGIDIEYRKLGALHALSALTIVSIPARRNMIWLYESLLY